MKQTIPLVFVFICVGSAFARVLFEENIDYPAGDITAGFSWLQFRKGVPPLVTSESLSNPGDMAPGIFMHPAIDGVYKEARTALRRVRSKR